MHQLGRVESRAMMGPDPASPPSSWRDGLRERTGPSLYGAEGLSKRDFSKRKSEKKKETLSGSLGNSLAAAPPASSPTSCPVFLQGCWGHKAHISGTRRSACLKGPPGPHQRHWVEYTSQRELRPHPRHWGESAP